jgi:hypothetical protein
MLVAMFLTVSVCAASVPNHADQCASYEALDIASWQTPTVEEMTECATRANDYQHEGRAAVCQIAFVEAGPEKASAPNPPKAPARLTF